MAEKSKKNKVKCKDESCPIHGNLSTRGRTFEGEVIRARMKRTVIVSWITREYIPKYERYGTKRSKVKAHVPSCIEVNEGDYVKIKECRPISKTKKFVVLEKIENERNKSKNK